MRRLTRTDGKNQQGLSRLVELHLVSTMADTLVVMALIKVLLSTSGGYQVRDHAGTSLLAILLPVIVVSAVAVPLIDRIPRGRRYALASTMLTRAVLAWVLATTITGLATSTSRFAAYTAACAVLASNRVYAALRASAVPRVMLSRTNLVLASSRITRAGVGAMAIAAVVGAALAQAAGPAWPLRLACLAFTAGTVLALAQSARIDSNEDEIQARFSSGRAMPPSLQSTEGQLGEKVLFGLRASTLLRGAIGVLAFFLPFLLSQKASIGLPRGATLVLSGALAAIGLGLGAALCGLLRRITPEIMITAVLALLTLTLGWATLGYGLGPLLAVPLVAGLALSLGGLSLTAIIQRDVPEHVRVSALARSELVLQICWVFGGGVALALPIMVPWGLGMAALLAAVGTVMCIVSLSDMARERRAVREPVFED